MTPAAGTAMTPAAALALVAAALPPAPALPVAEPSNDVDLDPPCVAKVRGARSGWRVGTIPPSRLSRAERRVSALLVVSDVDRPRTRGDCVDGARPCPFAGCQYHLYLDANPESGSIKLNFPHLEVWELAETCSLDVADRGGVTLEETGALINLTRERIRQVEVRAVARLRQAPHIREVLATDSDEASP